MPVTFFCGCGRKYLAGDDRVGDEFRCAACGGRVIIPLRSRKAPDPEAEAAVPDLPPRSEKRRGGIVRVVLFIVASLGLLGGLGGDSLGWVILAICLVGIAITHRP